MADYRIKPFAVRYAKIDRRDLCDRLQRDVHVGYCRFWSDRCRRPPSVSITVIEDAEDFVLWAKRIERGAL